MSCRRTVDSHASCDFFRKYSAAASQPFFGKPSPHDTSSLTIKSTVKSRCPETQTDSAVADLMGLGIELIEADWSLARMAGAFKARHRMSYADCFAAALAKDRYGIPYEVTWIDSG